MSYVSRGIRVGFSIKISAFLILSLAYACGDFDSTNLDHDQVMKGEDGAKGEQGNTGEKGQPGPDGTQGPQGPAGLHSVLLDQEQTKIGYYLQRVNFADNTFEIMTVEGFRTVIDLDDAIFKVPTEMAGGVGVSCVYESNDCSGSCFGYDERARGYLLNGQDGQIFSVDANAETVNITFNSYNEISALGTCSVVSNAAPNAVSVQIYDGVLQGTLTTPLYFDLHNPAGG